MTPAEVNEAADLLYKLNNISLTEAQIQAGGMGADPWTKLIDLAGVARGMQLSQQATTTICDQFQAALLAHVNRKRSAWTNRLAQLGVMLPGQSP